MRLPLSSPIFKRIKEVWDSRLRVACLLVCAVLTIGAYQAQLSIVHTKSEKNGKTYANIFSIAPLPKFDPDTGLPFAKVEIPADFKRKVPAAKPAEDDFLAGMAEPPTRAQRAEAEAGKFADVDDLPY